MVITLIKKGRGIAFKAILPEFSLTLTNLLTNPFNPETLVPFHHRDDASVTATICDVAGKLMRTLEPGHLSAGNYIEVAQAIHWDGKSDNGEVVSSAF